MDKFGNTYRYNDTIAKNSKERKLLNALIRSPEFVARATLYKHKTYVIRLTNIKKVTARQYELTIHKHPENVTVEELLKYRGAIYFKVYINKSYHIQKVLYAGLEI